MYILNIQIPILLSIQLLNLRACHCQQPAKLCNLQVKGKFTYTGRHVLEISIFIKVTHFLENSQNLLCESAKTGTILELILTSGKKQIGVLFIKDNLGFLFTENSLVQDSERKEGGTTQTKKEKIINVCVIHLREKQRISMGSRKSPYELTVF